MRYSRVRPVPYTPHHRRTVSASAVLTCTANTEKEYTALKISHDVSHAAGYA